MANFHTSMWNGRPPPRKQGRRRTGLLWPLVGRANGRHASRATRQPACGFAAGQEHAISAAARRRGPHAARRVAVLERGLDPGAEHLAALDARPQPAPARRQARTAAVRRLQFPPVRRDDPRQRGEPDPLHRPLPRGGLEDRLLVDGRRLVLERRHWPNTGTWEVDTKRFPDGLRAISDHAHGKGVRPSSGSSRSALPRAPGCPNNTRVAPGRDPTGRSGLPAAGTAEPRQPRGAGWLTDHVDELDHRSRASTSTGRTSTWTRWPTGGATTRRTARASPRSSTSPATWPTGTSCGGGIRTC